MPRATLFFAVALSVGLSACDVEQTQEAKLPDVDVQGGQLPNYDVDAPDVRVSSKEKTVTVPDVDMDVNTEKRTVTVPDVDVDRADADRDQG